MHKVRGINVLFIGDKGSTGRGLNLKRTWPRVGYIPKDYTNAFIGGIGIDGLIDKLCQFYPSHDAKVCLKGVLKNTFFVDKYSKNTNTKLESFNLGEYLIRASNEFFDNLER